MAATATDAAIARIAARFLDRTLPKEEWTHAAHFGTLLWLIAHRPEIVPERDLPDLIRAYNASVGGVNDDHHGYHETITQASIRMARAFLGRPGGESVAQALAALMASPLGRSDWPLAYWSRDRLFSVEARCGWCEPDVAPLG